ncbi:MAG: cyclic nucleotide-binding domain-containing protein [Pseudomonadales bacterium]|nr:cyclic nucleotide-binding domain-containing protein [Pseudomonadales bacterium]
MLIYDFLARNPEFSHASHAELQGLERSSHAICVPAKRWLVQRDRDLGAYFYLLRGSVETWHPHLIISPRTSHKHFYPGCSSVKTRANCQILRIDAAHRDLLHTSRNKRKDGASSENQSGWLSSFLESKMMQNLSRSQWRDVLRASRQLDVPAGNKIITRGQEGAECFVVESGLGKIHRGRRTLRRIGPGDFFGEDAVVTMSVRNADVSSLSPMRLHAIRGSTFCDIVVPKLVEQVDRAHGGIKLNVGVNFMLGSIPVDPVTLRERVAEFDPQQRYYLAGGSYADRTLCAFLLAQRGYKASVLSRDGAVLSPSA